MPEDFKGNFEDALKTNSQMFVLFYASWCPHSRRFLPIFAAHASKCKTPCLQVVVDDHQKLCDKYTIEYYPTVIFFEGGQVAKRLDAEPGLGLNEMQLSKLMEEAKTT